MSGDGDDHTRALKALEGMEKPAGNVVRRRWDDARAAMRIDDFEAFLDVDSPANRHLLMLLFGTLCLVASVAGTAVILPYADRLNLAVDMTLLRCVLSVALGLVALSVPGRLIPMPVIDALVVCAVLFIGFAVAATPQPIAGYLVLFYYWPIAALVVFRSDRATLAHYAFIGVSSGLVFLFDGDFSSRAFWWMLVIGMIVVVWWSTGWLVRRARYLAVAERTNRTRAEHASRSLVELNRRKSDFLNAMSHELRTPLNAVIGFAQMLRRQTVGPLNEAQAAYVEDILDSGQHLLALIDDTLDDAKVESGHYQLDVGEADAVELVDGAVRFVRDRAERSGIRVTVRAEGVGRVQLDERKVRQVLVNLLSNAVKFTPAGGSVSVTVRRTTKDTVFAVQDTGPGIPLGLQGAIFDEFEQGGAAASGEGTGLGLAVARAFVELHGGQIKVDSRPGRGARFSFTVPHALATEPKARRRPQAGATRARREVVDARENVGRVIIFLLFVMAGTLTGGLTANTPGASITFFWWATALCGLVVVLLGVARARMSEDPLNKLGLLVNVVVGVVALAGVYYLGPLAVGATLVIIGSGIFIRLFGHSSGLLSHPGRTHAAISGVCIAALFGMREGNTAPLLQWAIVMSSLGINSLLIGTLFERLQLLLAAEREAAEQAAALAAQLDEVSRHKSQFLAGMSHELRTPLNAVIGFGEALEREIPGPLNEAQRQYVEDIVLSGRHLLEVINQTLDLAKMDAGRLELRCRPVPLASVIETAVGQLRHLARERQVTVDHIAPENILVRADETRLCQALSAVIRNAVQVTPCGGSVAIDVGDQPTTCVVRVMDDGPGIDPVEQAAIFEPFHQAGTGSTLARDGAGLGLALARRLLELHRGSIAVESTPGCGALFTITVPRADDEPVEPLETPVLEHT